MLTRRRRSLCIATFARISLASKLWLATYAPPALAKWDQVLQTRVTEYSMRKYPGRLPSFSGTKVIREDQDSNGV